MKRIALCLAMSGFAAGAAAQNLIQNPTFDTDASGWDLSMYANWSNRVDHGDSPYSGSLQITTRTSDTGAQCIDVAGATTYAMSFWVEQDPQPPISPCASPSSGFSVALFDAKQCADPFPKRGIPCAASRSPLDGSIFPLRSRRRKQHSRPC